MDAVDAHDLLHVGAGFGQWLDTTFVMYDGLLPSVCPALSGIEHLQDFWVTLRYHALIVAREKFYATRDEFNRAVAAALESSVEVIDKQDKLPDWLGEFTADEWREFVDQVVDEDGSLIPDIELYLSPAAGFRAVSSYRELDMLLVRSDVKVRLSCGSICPIDIHVVCILCTIIKNSEM